MSFRCRSLHKHLSALSAVRCDEREYLNFARLHGLVIPQHTDGFTPKQQHESTQFNLEEQSMTWRDVDLGGDINKWSENLVVEGTIHAFRENRVGKLVVFSDVACSVAGHPDRPAAVELDAHDRITFGLHTMLASALANVSVGTRVRVHCLGKGTNSKGNQMWSYRVSVDDEAVDKDIAF